MSGMHRVFRLHAASQAGSDGTKWLAHMRRRRTDCDDVLVLAIFQLYYCDAQDSSSPHLRPLRYPSPKSSTDSMAFCGQCGQRIGACCTSVGSEKDWTIMSALKMKTLEDSAVKREPEEESTGTTASLDDTETTTSMLTTEDVFSLLYSDFPHRVAKETSRRERKQNGYISMSLVYGEIAYGPFKSVLDEIKHCHYALQKPGGVFLDIGSGSGKAVFAAALAHDFDACYGIEILEGLHSISQVVLNDWDRRIKRLPSISLQKKRMRIEFAYGDALEMDWPVNVDVFFLNSTCFTASFFRELTKKLAVSCKPGAVIITATHALPDTTNFDLLRELHVPQEAWGTATWFVQRKK